MKLIKVVLVLSGTMFAASAFADREFADIYTECGIGAIIAPNNEAVAAVTNVTWDLGTTAILSNLSSEETCEGGGGKSAALIFEAYPNIEKDLAIGDGAHLNALLDVVDVDAADRDAVKAELRERLASIATASDYSEQSRYQKAEQLFDALHETIS